MKQSEIEIIEARVEAAASLFKVIGSPVRLKLICALYSGEKNVGALKETLGMSQSALSQHLQCLRAQGLVMVRPHGSERYYSLVKRPVCDVLRALKVVCEQQSQR